MPYLASSAGLIHYQEAGAGIPLLLLSANPGDSRDFDAIIPALARHYHVIAPDWPGYGRSTLDIAPESVDLAMHDRVLRELLDALGQQPVLIIGNSLGGNVAARLAISCPERVRGLVLVSPGGFTPHNVFTRGFCRWQGSRFALSPRSFAGLYLRRRTPVVEQMLERAVGEQSGGVALLRNRAVWRSFLEADYDLRPQAHRIQSPVMLAYGRMDPVISPYLDGRVARKCLPLARFAEFACGHAPFAELPDAFLAQVEPFLAECAGRPASGEITPGATVSGSALATGSGVPV